jgi:pimeloyl-ACP methyl ester carboxylesterase
VCLHAGVTDKRLWAPAVEAFGATHPQSSRTTAAALGETRLPSPREREPFAQRRRSAAVLDALAIDRAVLMGCSQGRAHRARHDACASVALCAHCAGRQRV